MTVYVLWHGGYSYAPGYVDDDVEVLDSMAAARELCDSRYWNRDGYTPAVDESSGMSVWFEDPRGTDDPYPDRLIVRGPRGGWRVT